MQPVPLVKGQQTRTQPGVLPTVIEVVLVEPTPPSPTMVPAMPESVPPAPERYTQGSGPSSNVLLLGSATSEIAPGVTQTDCVPLVEVAAPPMLTEHHESKL